MENMDPDLKNQIAMLEGMDTGVSTTVEPMKVPEVAENVEVPKAVPTTNPTVEPVNTTVPTTNPTVEPVNTTVEMPNLNQAPVFVNLGASTYQLKTNFLTLKENERTRVTLANLNFIRVHIHWIDGLGKVKCLSTYDENNRWPTTRALCCQEVDPKTGKQKNAKNRLLVPVVEYPISRQDGKTLIPNAKPVLRMWDMNYVEEKQLMDILDMYKQEQGVESYDGLDLSKFDLSLNKSKSGDYATITLVSMPSWRSNENWNTLVKEAISTINQDFYNDAYKECARVVSEAQIANTLSAKKAQEAEVTKMMNQPVPDISQLNLGM